MQWIITNALVDQNKELNILVVGKSVALKTGTVEVELFLSSQKIFKVTLL